MQALSPALRFPPETLLAAQGPARATGSDEIGLKVCFFDVDGVLTDGRLWISEEGESLKAFHALDGHGLKLLPQGGITPVVITGRDSPAVRRRVADLGLVHAHYGVSDKRQVAQAVLRTLGLDWSDAAPWETTGRTCPCSPRWPSPACRQAPTPRFARWRTTSHRPRLARVRFVSVATSC